jgi:hypothetical protein
MRFTIESVVDAGNDVLLVTAHDEDGNEVTATGWVSATTNHYDAGDYYPAGSELPQDGVDELGDPLPPLDVSGHLKPDATPRAMTPAEVGAYALQLLAEQNPTPEAVAPAAIEFTT